ncbi:MAG: DegV family protein [Ruminococcaceae bacterium]|nr:DegV family protein [Oscillospiraceae bacterium]
MSVRIIIDSASDLRAEVAAEKGLLFAPLKTFLDGTEYRDGIDITPDVFYDKLKANKELARTSQVNASEFAALYEQAIAAGDDVLVITISSGLSGTYQSAVLAKEGYEDRVLVLDSLSASAGEQVLIARAVALRDEGRSAKEIYEELLVLRKRLRLILRVETLEYLKRGGRISKTAAFVGGMLRVMPILILNSEGKLENVGKARGVKMSHKMLNEQIALSGIDPTMPVAITYAGSLDDGAVDAYLADSGALFDEERDNLSIGELGCVIGTHTGPGAIVIGYISK